MPPGRQRARCVSRWIRENLPLAAVLALCGALGGGGANLIWNLASTLALKADVESVATKEDIESVNAEIARLRQAVERMSAGSDGVPALAERKNGVDADLKRIEAALGVERERVNDVQLFIGELQGRTAAPASSGGNE